MIPELDHDNEQEPFKGENEKIENRKNKLFDALDKLQQGEISPEQAVEVADSAKLENKYLKQKLKGEN